MDGNSILKYQTDYSELGKEGASRRTDTIGFGSDGNVRVKSAEVAEVTGEGMILRGHEGAGAMNLPEGADMPAAAAP